ncbi:MAG: tRNA (cytidine(34)-2'-O)-methyltransferase [Rhizomicrobium sp.]|jgi:tRNA (cytidine/uridine-2'-O-)-methyltransferase
MRLALFQPDIAQNTGALIRLGACLGVEIEIIEPCGFVFSDKGLRRAGMDYLELAKVTRHASWSTWCEARTRRRGDRLVLLTSKALHPYTDFAFAPEDTILLGRESAGVPAEVHDAADARLRIPLLPGLRSLNVAQAGAMALGEALRQTNGFPQ